MTTALVLDPDAVGRCLLTQRLTTLDLVPVACARADEARRALTNRLFDLVVYRRPPTPFDRREEGATQRLLAELVGCPTPVVALADRVAGSGPDPDPPIAGVAVWLPLDPTFEQLATVVRDHALRAGQRRSESGFGRP
ncbi:MAG: hypothetical protein AAFN30_04825 [Actinomycetota bacterium]